MESNIMKLQQNYDIAIPSAIDRGVSRAGLTKMVDSIVAKFTNLIDEMVRNSFAKTRCDWFGNNGRMLLLNNPNYKDIIAEIAGFPDFVRPGFHVSPIELPGPGRTRACGRRGGD